MVDESEPRPDYSEPRPDYSEPRPDYDESESEVKQQQFVESQSESETESSEDVVVTAPAPAPKPPPKKTGFAAMLLDDEDEGYAPDKTESVVKPPPAVNPRQENIISDTLHISGIESLQIIQIFEIFNRVPKKPGMPEKIIAQGGFTNLKFDFSAGTLKLISPEAASHALHVIENYNNIVPDEEAEGPGVWRARNNNISARYATPDDKQEVGTDQNGEEVRPALRPKTRAGKVVREVRNIIKETNVPIQTPKGATSVGNYPVAQPNIPQWDDNLDIEMNACTMIIDDVVMTPTSTTGSRLPDSIDLTSAQTPSSSMAIKSELLPSSLDQTTIIEDDDKTVEEATHDETTRDAEISQDTTTHDDRTRLTEGTTTEGRAMSITRDTKDDETVLDDSKDILDVLMAQDEIIYKHIQRRGLAKQAVESMQQQAQQQALLEMQQQQMMALQQHMIPMMQLHPDYNNNSNNNNNNNNQNNRKRHWSDRSDVSDRPWGTEDQWQNAERSFGYQSMFEKRRRVF